MFSGAIRLAFTAMVNIIAGMHALPHEAAYEKNAALQQLQPIMGGRPAK
jgi:hypothetical protein